MRAFMFPTFGIWISVCTLLGAAWGIETIVFTLNQETEVVRTDVPCTVDLLQENMKLAFEEKAVTLSVQCEDQTVGYDGKSLFNALWNERIKTPVTIIDPADVTKQSFVTIPTIANISCTFTHYKWSDDQSVACNLPK